MYRSSLSIIFVFCFALSSFSYSQPVVRIGAEARVENEVILLRDIARVTGGEEEATKRILRISLGYAPNIGAVREIPRGRIALAIAAAGFSKTDYLLEAPSMIRISRAGQSIEPERLRETITQSVSSKFDEIEFEIVKIDLPQAFDLPLGEVEFEAKLDGVRNLFAPFSLPIEIRIDKRIIRSISVDVEIHGFAEVFVANRDLPSNVSLSESDLALERVRLEKPITNYLRRAEDLRGIKLVKNVSLGSVLTKDTFVADIVVKTGDQVKIVGKSESMSISIIGKAQGSGRIGDRISVINLQSNLLVQATVMDEGLVKVFF